MRARAMLRLLAALFAFTLIAAACGDDDTTTDAAGSGTDDSADEETAEDEMTDGEMSDDDMADGEHSDGDHDDGDHSDHDDGEMADDEMGDGDDGHDHDSTIEVTSDPAPTVGIEVWSDPAGGVNIRAISTDFTVAPESASTDHVEGEGHYHLYVDGEKALRFYNDCVYWPGVDEGEHTFAVELSANDHSSLTVGGEPLMAELTFDVPAHSHDDHSHDDPTDFEWDGTTDPVLSIEVTDDPKSGWNAAIEVEGLELSCDNASGDHVAGEGHLHIYANGEKLGRLYGGDTHIAALPEGDVEIRVAAYTNDHQPYVVGGVPVEATTTVTVEAEA